MFALPIEYGTVLSQQGDAFANDYITLPVHTPGNNNGISGLCLLNCLFYRLYRFVFPHRDGSRKRAMC